MIRLILTISFLTILTAVNAQSDVVKTDFMWGKIENGHKTGYWQYFDNPGELSLMINYSTGKLKYIKKDTSKYLIKQNGIWIESKVSSPPHFIGSKQQIKDYLMQNVRFPREARIGGVQGITAISFTIDETGNASNFEIVKGLSGGYPEEVIRVLSEMPNTWIQAVTGSAPVESKIIIVISFGLGEKYVASKKDKKKYPLLFQDKAYIMNFEKVAIGIDRYK